MSAVLSLTRTAFCIGLAHGDFKTMLRGRSSKNLCTADVENCKRFIVNFAGMQSYLEMWTWNTFGQLLEQWLHNLLELGRLNNIEDLLQLIQVHYLSTASTN